MVTGKGGMGHCSLPNIGFHCDTSYLPYGRAEKAKDGSGASEYKGDERLKNIEPKMVELIMNEVCVVSYRVRVSCPLLRQKCPTLVWHSINGYLLIGQLNYFGFRLLSV